MADVSRIMPGKLNLHYRPLDVLCRIAAAIAVVRPAANAIVLTGLPKAPSVGAISGDALPDCSR